MYGKAIQVPLLRGKRQCQQGRQEDQDHGGPQDLSLQGV